MEAHPLATLVTGSGEGLIATHLPLLVDRTRGAHGTLAGHIARANPCSHARFASSADPEPVNASSSMLRPSDASRNLFAI